MGGRGSGRGSWEPTPAQLLKAEELAERGLTMVHIARCLGIGERCMRAKRKVLADFAAALDRGMAKGDALLIDAAYKSAIDDRDPSQLRFMLRARGLMDDRKPVEICAPGGGPIQIAAEVRAEIDVKPTPAILELMKKYADVARAALAGPADAGDVDGQRS